MDQHDDDFEVNGIRVYRDGRNTMWEATPRFDQKATKDAMIAAGEAAAARSREIVAELRQLVGSVNAIHLVGQVGTWATVGLDDSDDAEALVGREAQAEFLLALAVESGRPEGDLATPDVLTPVQTLLHDLFEFERDRITGEELASSRDATDVLEDARYWLRMESLIDRTQGYVRHLQIILDRIFEPIRAECRGAVGFCPSDVSTLVSAHIAIKNEAFDARLDTARGIAAKQKASGESVENLWYALLHWVIFGLVDPAGDVDPDQLAQRAALPVGEVTACLEAMTTSWGQPVRQHRPGTPTPVRRRSVLRGRSGRYAWPLPWASQHECLPWVGNLVRERDLSAFAVAVSGARSAATEQLTAEAMADVFGAERVHGGFEYPLGGGNWAECDVVVSLPGHALAIECKSGGLADDFRYGDVDYASSTLTTFVEHPFEQSQRAAEFLTAGPGKFRIGGTSTKRNWSGVPDVTRIAVSLERIDPLVLIAGRASLSDAAGTSTWVVCLADLLLIADVLPDKHAFFAYARIRAELASNPSVMVIAEADLLGAFIHDRLRNMRRALRDDPDRHVALNQHTQDLNAYFGADAIGRPLPKKPALKVAKLAEKRLNELWAAGDSDWANAAVTGVAGAV